MRRVVDVSPNTASALLSAITSPRCSTVVADDGVAIVLLGNRLPAGLVQVIAAHELLHVVQLEYGATAVRDSARVEFERR